MTDTARHPSQKIPTSAAEALSEPVRRLWPESLEGRILFVILALLTLWAMAILTFGLPAFVYPMKLIVPGMIAMLIVITQGM